MPKLNARESKGDRASTALADQGYLKDQQRFAQRINPSFSLMASLPHATGSESATSITLANHAENLCKNAPRT